MPWLERVQRANHWYDRLSPRDGALISMWLGAGLFVGAGLLSFYLGFTFWALLLLGFGALVILRLMYRLGRFGTPQAADGPPSQVRLPYADPMLSLNLWFDSLPPLSRMVHAMGWLFGSFVVSLLLTALIRFPLALPFVGVALFMLVARLGYAHGWLGAPEREPAPALPVVSQLRIAAEETVPSPPLLVTEPVAQPVRV